MLPEVLRVAAEYNRRVPTGLLNQVVREAVDRRHPPPRKGKTLKIYYTSQVQVGPPTIQFWVNDPELLPLFLWAVPGETGSGRNSVSPVPAPVFLQKEGGEKSPILAFRDQCARLKRRFSLEEYLFWEEICCVRPYCSDHQLLYWRFSDSRGNRLAQNRWISVKRQW